MICYRKFGKVDLVDVSWERWLPLRVGQQRCCASQFKCRTCFPIGEKVSACAECVRYVERQCLSPGARLHDRLGCEHICPDALK
jgi:hypothetical protein